MVEYNAGILDKRITIQSKVETDDGEGGVTETWTDVLECWAQVQPFGGKQVYEYRSLNVKATHRIKVRGEIDVTEADRIIFRSRIFKIHVIEDELEENVLKWITCEEIRN